MSGYDQWYKSKKIASSKKKKESIRSHGAKNDEADGYIVYYSKKEDGNYTKLKTFTSRNNLSYTHTKLTNGTAYYYKIQAYKNFNGGKLYGPMTPYLKYCDYYSYTDESYESRCRRAFGKSYYADYKSAKQAKKHMKNDHSKSMGIKKVRKNIQENSVSL